METAGSETTTAAADEATEDVSSEAKETGSYKDTVEEIVICYLPNEASDEFAEYRSVEDEVEAVRNIASLHDIGKIDIPDGILNKPDKLNDEEYEIMKQHTQYGYDILKEITIFPDISLGARYHHERIDGKGYPSDICDDEIPTIAKIIAVADTFDAMNSTRPYRGRLPMDI